MRIGTASSLRVKRSSAVGGLQYRRISIWDLDGRVLEANEAFLRIVVDDRDDLISGAYAGRILFLPRPGELLKSWVALLRAARVVAVRMGVHRKDGSRCR